jgi:hypothetical protein
MNYKLIKCSSSELQILEEDELFWTVALAHPFSREYGFDAFDGGNRYQLKKTGIFFWKRLILFQNGVMVGRFRRNRCLEPKPRVWLDSRKFVFEGDAYICSLDHGRKDHVYSWSLDRKDLEMVVTVLALISIQGRVRIWASSLPG